LGAQVAARAFYAFGISDLAETQVANPEVKVPLLSLRSRAYEHLRSIGLARTVVHSSRQLLSRYRVPVWHLEGIGRVDGIRLSILFAGHLKNKNYIAHLAFAEGYYSERFLGAKWLWAIWRQGIRSGADLVMTLERSVSRKARRPGPGFCVPCWIGSEADIEQAVHLCRTSENIKHDARRAKRNGFTYEMTNDPDAIASFYSSMYLPYIQRAHGSRTMVTPWEEFAAELDRAELMTLQKAGETIAGSLLIDLGSNRARARAVGVRHGDHQYVRLGAVAALYYFEIGYLQQKGYKRIHYGATRAFLKDGVLAFKKKYGAQVVDKDQRIFRIRVARYSAGAKAFLQHNPFISEHDGRFYANFFVNQLTEVETSSLRSDIARYRIGGIDGVRVHVTEDAHAPLDGNGPSVEPVVFEFDGGVQ
jgi:hypothetical protein